jgi:hypothetical protein
VYQSTTKKRSLVANTGTEQVGVAVKLLTTFIQEVLSSNIGQDMGYLD